MKKISSKEAKDNMSEVLNQVAYAGQKFKIARRNKDMAIIIPIDEWKIIEKILKDIEDQEDILAAEEALERIEKEGSISLDEMKKKLGL